MRHPLSINVALLLPLTFLDTVNAFLPSNSYHQTRSGSKSTSSSALNEGADDLFENFKRMWGEAFGDQNSKNDASNATGDDDAAGTTLIASVPGTMNIANNALASHVLLDDLTRVQFYVL